MHFIKKDLCISTSLSLRVSSSASNLSALRAQLLKMRMKRAYCIESRREYQEKVAGKGEAKFFSSPLSHEYEQKRRRCSLWTNLFTYMNVLFTEAISSVSMPTTRTLQVSIVCQNTATFFTWRSSRFSKQNDIFTKAHIALKQTIWRHTQRTSNRFHFLHSSLKSLKIYASNSFKQAIWTLPHASASSHIHRNILTAALRSCVWSCVWITVPCEIGRRVLENWGVFQWVLILVDTTRGKDFAPGTSLFIFSDRVLFLFFQCQNSLPLSVSLSSCCLGWKHRCISILYMKLTVEGSTCNCSHIKTSHAQRNERELDWRTSSVLPSHC